MARPESIEMIARLIGFDTTSRNSNLPLIEFARARLEALGASCRTIFDETGTKANLFATLGPRDRPGYILSGHTDVVPAKAEVWTSDPFGLAERDGRLYGRGACDMKGFVGIVLTLAPEFVRRGLKAPLHVALSYDEELGCVGVRKLIAHLGHHERHSLGCIVGEPTRMRVVLGHKGKETWRCRVSGRAAHASEAPRHPSAIEGAARAVAHLYDLARVFEAEPASESGFDLPFTTINVGALAGGGAVNVVAAEASIDLEIRFLPGFEPSRVIDGLRQFCHSQLPGHGFTLERIAGYPGLDQPEESAIARLAQRIGRSSALERVAFGTEAGLFREAGIPTIVCGPGSIDQAHTVDEYLSLEQVTACEGFLEQLMDEVCET